MKGKIFLGLALGAVGAIYMYLVYPLLQNTPAITSNEERSIGDINIIPAPEPGSIDSRSDTEGQIDSTQKQEISINSICFQENCFTLEIADTPELRQQGLMQRDVLAMDAGMLFVFDTSDIHEFWMKNTLIPLDIAWMNEDFVIVDIATMTPCLSDPCPSYTPTAQSMYALEINAGLLERYIIKIGDIAIHK